MIETMGAAVDIAENAGVTLAFEPERANVVYNAREARELLTSASPTLKVVLDPRSHRREKPWAPFQLSLTEPLTCWATHRDGPCQR